MEINEAYIKFDVVRVFKRRADGSVIPCGETIRVNHRNYALYILPCDDNMVGGNLEGIEFKGRLLIIGEIEEFFDPNSDFEILGIDNFARISKVGTVRIKNQPKF